MSQPKPLSPSTQDPSPSGFSSRVLIILFCLVALLLVVGGTWFYILQAQATRADKYAELKSIADLKVEQIVQWRSERLADASLFTVGDFIRPAILDWLAAPEDEDLKADVVERLTQFKGYNHYHNIILAAPDGRLLLSLEPALLELDPGTQDFVRQTASTGIPLFGDFIISPEVDHIHLDISAPVLDDANRPAAVLILRVDPSEYLYPLIQSWPTPSRSAETLLVGRDADSVVYLNTLRYRSDPPLTIRIPLSETNVLAVQAVLGRVGATEGVDYRGVAVVGDILPVPGTAWYMIAKVDTAEMLAGVHSLGWAVVGFISLGVLMTTFLAAYVINLRQQRLYQQLLRAGRQRFEAQEETRMILYSIGDGVIATDREGRVNRLNPVAELLTGWSEEDARGQPVTSVFNIVNEDSHAEVENPVQRVLQEGLVVGLANHTLLISRDGSERPIADSGAPIRSESGEISGVVLVFRDQSEERVAENELRMQQERFAAAFYSSPYAITISRLSDGFIYEVNEGFVTMSGYQYSEAVGKTTIELNLWPDDVERLGVIDEMLKNKRLRGRECHFQHRSGRQVIGRYSAEVLLINGELCAFSSIEDITELKKAEQALHESEARWQFALSGAGDGVWDWNAQTNQVYFSNEWKSMLGYAPDEISDNLDEWDRRLHSDDRERTYAELNRHLDGITPVYTSEHRLRCKDGSYKWILDRGKVISRDADGKPLRVIGTHTDITQRKQTEELLSQQVEELRRWHALTLGREARILELKSEVNELAARLGQPRRYTSTQEGNGQK